MSSLAGYWSDVDALLQSVAHQHNHGFDARADAHAAKVSFTLTGRGLQFARQVVDAAQARAQLLQASLAQEVVAGWLLPRREAPQRQQRLEGWVARQRLVPTVG